MMVGPQDALGVLYSFILVICPPTHKNCTDHPEKTRGAIVKRQDRLGQYECDVKLAAAGERVTGSLKGRVWLRCEKKEEPNA